LVARNDLSGAIRQVYQVTVGTLRYPRRSPDGTEILLGTGTSLIVINSDGLGAITIPNHKAGDWNADGTKIFAISSTNQLVSMNPDGTGISASLFDGSGGGGMVDLDVNGAGTKIAFTSIPNGWIQIKTIDPDGSNVSAALTALSGEANLEPRWNADGTGKVQLTNTTEDEFAPLFRSDNSIAYTRISGNRQVWTMNEDGTGQAVLEASPGEDLAFPDGP
jgi:Tol biopolymer transport system component